MTAYGTNRRRAYPKQDLASALAKLPQWPKAWALRRDIRVVSRAILLCLWTFVAIPIQALMLGLPGKGKIAFAKVYWRGVCAILGLSVRQLGMIAAQDGPVVFVSNHSSWIDIAVLGSVLPACFIAKQEVAQWPLIGLVARLGRTVFISRKPGQTVRENDAIGRQLRAGVNLILFAEGTTSDGVRVLPFRSSFFALGEGEGPRVFQPVSIVYDRLNYLPVRRLNRSLFSWYGDMSLAPHFRRIAAESGLRATVLLHPPITCEEKRSRKELAHAIELVVARGAAKLRQNREG